jgi:hypothetical protein
MFYTYLYLREDGTPYYVGKGKGRRAFRKGQRQFNVPVDKSNILIQEFESEADAFEAEKFLIEYYGRKDLGAGCLRNLTDGGEGGSGRVVSDSIKEQLRLRMLGTNYSIGHKVSDVSLQALLAGTRRRQQSAELNHDHSLKMRGAGNPMFGKRRPDGLCSKAGKEGSKKTNHIRWHLNRGLTKLDCEFCAKVKDAAI